MKQRVHRRQIPNAQILDSADSFKAAWDLLGEQPPGFGFVLPQINVGAIAIELYLKSLSAEDVHTPDTTSVGLYLKGLFSTGISHPSDSTHEDEDEWTVVTAKSKKSGHILVDLFNTISPDLRRAIDDAFSSTESDPKRTFCDVISDLEGAFSASRYSFESGRSVSKYSLWELGLVVQCLHDFIHGIVKP